jgi:hypothetical protein
MMNKRIKELAEQAGYEKDMFGIGHWDMPECQKFAELVVKDCANFVRETYDHEAAESIAWCMEIKYGLHGDYA